MSFLYVSGCRISEALLLTRAQIEIGPEFVTVRNFLNTKRRKAREPVSLGFRPEVYFPKTGRLAPFTDLFMAYVKGLDPSQQRVFPFSRVTAWKHVTRNTAYWDHWFRAMGETFILRMFDNNVIAAAKYLNVAPESLEPYVQPDLGAFKSKMLT